MHNQRCAVRVMYTSNKVAGQWRAHGRYIARESVTGDHRTAGFGQSGEELPPGDKLARWQSAGDPRIWKLILSPEFGDRVDLDQMTREVLVRMERDLGTKLEWVAVTHFNTDHPHVHVALRGIRDDGSPLDLPREYVRSGIRQHAEQVCTLQLGYRTSLDAAAAERREIASQRLTSLDRLIARSSLSEHPKADANRFVYQEPTRRGNKDSNAHVIARLRTLRSMGLADETGGGLWLVRRDFQSVLRAMQQVADRQKMLARHGALLSDHRLPVQLLDMRKLKVLEGRVLIHGEDEQTGRQYMLLEGTDAKVHVVHHTTEIAMARERGQMRPNSFVRLRRLFQDGRPVLDVEDHGDADKLLRNRTFMRQRTKARFSDGDDRPEWGGWLGRFQAALSQNTDDRGKPPER